jgi:hypothetical protein
MILIFTRDATTPHDHEVVSCADRATNARVSLACVFFSNMSYHGNSTTAGYCVLTGAAVRCIYAKHYVH